MPGWVEEDVDADLSDYLTIETCLESSFELLMNKADRVGEICVYPNFDTPHPRELVVVAPSFSSFLDSLSDEEGEE